MQRTSIYLDDQDRVALGVIKEAHGIATDAGAVRFAVRKIAREIERRQARGQRTSKTTGSGTDGGES